MLDASTNLSDAVIVLLLRFGDGLVFRTLAANLAWTDRGAVGNLAAGTQANETLEIESVEQLKFHLLVAQVKQLLKWRTATTRSRLECGAAWANSAAKAVKLTYCAITHSP